MNKKNRPMLACAIILPLLFASGCDKPSASTPTTTSEDTTPTTPVPVNDCTITYTNGDGYSIVGPATVKQGGAISFTVTVESGYESSAMVVKANGNEVTGSEGNYYISNIQENLTITVEGVYKKSSITLQTSLYRFNIVKITDEQKKGDYYINNATGSYRGNYCAVSVDMSEVDFTQPGSYAIKYSLVGHEEVVAYAAVEIYEVPVASDVSIDLVDYAKEVLPYKSFGEAHVDFTLKDHTNKVLTGDEFYYDSATNTNHFSSAYISTLPIDQALAFVAVYEEEDVPFKVTITDKEDAQVTFSLEAGEYAYTVAEKQTLPYASIASSSLQKLTFVYTLDGKAVTNPATYTLDKIGDYNYKIQVLRNGAAIDSLEKEYTIHIVNSFEVDETTDLNSSIFYYNKSIFGRYFSGCEILSTSPASKTAKIHGQRINLTNEIITLAKERGFKYIKISFDMVADSGEEINSIPFISQGSDADGFWERYWNQQNCSNGRVTTLVDLSRIDLVDTPTWYLTFSFRTATSNGSDVDAIGTVSGIEFLTEDTTGVDLWASQVSCSLANGQIHSKTKFSIEVGGLSYNWFFFGFKDVTGFMAEGYDAVRVTVEGNNYGMYAYVGKELNIETCPEGTAYTHRIPSGGGTTVVPLVEGYPFAAIMTSHEIDGGGVEGQFGDMESFTITMEFIMNVCDFDALCDSTINAGEVFQQCTINSVDSVNKTIAITAQNFVTEEHILLSEKCFDSLRRLKKTSFSFDFTPANTEVKSMVPIVENLDGTTTFPGAYVFMANSDGVITFTLGSDIINSAKLITFIARDENAFDGQCLLYNTAVISNIHVS